MHKIEIPRENANDDEVVITDIFVSNHEIVHKGQIILEFETSKASIEIEANLDGIISLSILKGEKVDVGAIVAIISEEAITPEELSNLTSNSSTEIVRGEDKFSIKALELMSEHKMNKSLFDKYDFVTADMIEVELSKHLGAHDAEILLPVFKQSDVVFYGAGLQCQVALDLINTEGLDLDVLGIVDSNPSVGSLDGIPVFNKKQLEKMYLNGLRQVHICIGNGPAKKVVAEQLKKIGFKIISLVSKTAHISKTSIVGDGVFVGPHTLLGREVVIGDFCQINHGTTIAHHSNIGSGTFIADGCMIAGTVTIGTDCSLGIGVVINRGLDIGFDVSIPSGAVVIDDISPKERYRFKKIHKG